MYIYTRLVFNMETGTTLAADCYEYDGPVAQCCGASVAQNAALGTQTAITNQVMQQGQQVFGQSSQVFNDLTNSLAPTVAAGPNQQGFSPTELSDMQSQAITQNGQAYKNAKAATGDAMSSVGGGNTSLPNGATAGVDASLASGAASNTANALGQITQANYATGRQNYDTALQGLSGATGVFNSATNLDNSASSAAAGESDTANQIATQSNSWVQAVTGALGTVAGAAVGKIPNSGGGATNLANLNAGVALGNSTPVGTTSYDTNSLIG